MVAEFYRCQLTSGDFGEISVGANQVLRRHRIQCLVASGLAGRLPSAFVARRSEAYLLARQRILPE